MVYKDIAGMKISELCLGGGKMVDMPIEQGLTFVQTARELGINIFDAHHRYGNCEKILKKYDTKSGVRHMDRINDMYFIMTKASAYEYENRWSHIERSIELLKYIDILWISDLDNEELYKRGSKIYREVGSHFPRIGVTTEDPQLALRFMEERPECKFYMIPVFASRPEMYRCARTLREAGKYVFAIKPFDDGREFIRGYTVHDCLKYLRVSPANVVIFGTKNVNHLKEVVRIWESL